MLASQKRSDDIVREQYFSSAVVSDSPSNDSFVPVEDNPQAKTAHCATITGSMLGAIGGCLAGMGILAIPGFVPILAIGSAGTAVVVTLAGAGIGLAGGGLISIAATDKSED